MITEFKLFESLEEVELQNNFANAICDLYEVENITVQSNFYDYTEENPSYLFKIVDFHKNQHYKNEDIIEIEYYKSEPWIYIQSFEKRNEDVENFIKFVLGKYDHVWIVDIKRNRWSIDNFDLINLPYVIKDLSIDNYRIWKDVNKYNL
jgi:hypothetical protein